MKINKYYLGKYYYKLFPCMYKILKINAWLLGVGSFSYFMVRNYYYKLFSSINKILKTNKWLLGYKKKIKKRKLYITNIFYIFIKNNKKLKTKQTPPRRGPLRGRPQRPPPPLRAGQHPGTDQGRPATPQPPHLVVHVVCRVSPRGTRGAHPRVVHVGVFFN